MSKFYLSVLPMIFWTINRHWSGNCLVLNTISQDVITGTNDDIDAYLHHLASMV